MWDKIGVHGMYSCLKSGFQPVTTCGHERPQSNVPDALSPPLSITALDMVNIQQSKNNIRGNSLKILSRVM